MRRATLCLAALVLSLIFSPLARAGGGPECWRRGGPPALAALMAEHAEAIQRHRDGKPVENWAKIAADLDAVAAQRDAWASGLYWYTDLDAAKAAAKREGKPIVSLRLLGRLDEDLSCANSRYFRTTLYPAAEVSRRMRENFILHWSSERPVPVVTVDYGDGRKLQRTVTGNSAHYLMTSDGEVVDVLPGLYGAKPFAAWLDEAGGMAKRVAAMTASDRVAAVKTYHVRERDDVAAQWAADQRAVGATASAAVADASGVSSLQGRWITSAAAAGRASGVASSPVSARRAGELAISKVMPERPLVRLVSAADPKDADEALWAAIANLHIGDAMIDPVAVALIRSKRPSGNFDTTLLQLRASIAQDTVRNEYTLHRRVHEWFAGASGSLAFEPLNQRVYAELFLTPRSDPWLGLAPANVWSGLEEDGLTSTVTASAR